jgi:hypothetical protein
VPTRCVLVRANRMMRWVAGLGDGWHEPQPVGLTGGAENACNCALIFGVNQSSQAGMRSPVIVVVTPSLDVTKRSIICIIGQVASEWGTSGEL